MNFEEFIKEINSTGTMSVSEAEKLTSKMDINIKNYGEWTKAVCGERTKEIDVEKLPFVIDVLYRSNNNYKVALSLLLIKELCYQLPYVTNLENYIISAEKYSMIKSILVDIFDEYDNGISDCMMLIVLQNDPNFSLFDKNEKKRLCNTIKRKLDDVILYMLGTENVHPSVFASLEVYIDLAANIEDGEIRERIKMIDSLPLNYECKLFIAKYKILNNLPIDKTEIEYLFSNKTRINQTLMVFENIGANDLIPYDKISQKEIALSNMLDWLSYPTEIGDYPDEIELIGVVNEDGYNYYAYKFSSKHMPDRGEMLGVSGGYKEDEITQRTNGYTFSKFEKIEENWKEQSKSLISFISESVEELKRASD